MKKKIENNNPGPKSVDRALPSFGVGLLYSIDSVN